MITQHNHRYSNIELLRIIAMIFVMFGHSQLRISPMPVMDAIGQHPFSSYLDVMSRCVATTGVGVFIAISGWFGIKFKLKGLAKYIYMIFFTLWFIYALALACNKSEFNFNGVKIALGFYDGYWFIMGYLGLYLISPILNTFINHASKKEIQVVLLSYYLFQSYYSWVSGWFDYYGGYSVILFGGIYLTASYLRKYPIDWLQDKAIWLLFVTILAMATIAYFALYKFGHAARQVRDENPLVILTCRLFVLSFCKLRIQSRFVNWLAASCFVVYLIHFSPIIYPHFMRLIRIIYSQFDGFIYGAVLFIFLFIVYLICTLFDQLRIVSWNIIQKMIFK